MSRERAGTQDTPEWHEEGLPRPTLDDLRKFPWAGEGTDPLEDLYDAS